MLVDDRLNMKLLGLIGSLLLLATLPDLYCVSSALAVGPNASDDRVVSLDEPMLDCARLTDVAKKLKCFDRAKSNAPHVVEPKKQSQPQADSGPKLDRSLDTNRTASDALVISKSKKKTPAEILSDYGMEVVRQLGKEMRAEEYPVHAREQGIGGMVHALLHIGTDGRIADATVASSSGNVELDQYVVDKLSRLRLPQIPLEFRARAFAVPIPVKFAVRSN
jgi:TonB family protein